MSCGNESALWDIIQFLLDKIHHPLGTHLPLRQETPKIAKNFRDLQNFVLPTQGRAPQGGQGGEIPNEIGRAEEHPKIPMGSSRTAPHSCSPDPCACPRHSPNFPGEHLCSTILHLTGSLREKTQDELRLKSPLQFSSSPASVGILGKGPGALITSQRLVL